MVSRRQRGELLLTRAARDEAAAAARLGAGAGAAAAAPSSSAAAVALVRVRLPDGCSLEGRFGAHEPYPESVREFVRAALREQRIPFELSAPPPRQEAGGGRKRGAAVASAPKTVRDAGLCPSAVLNFRGEGAAALASSGALLKDEVLRGGSWA